MKTKLFILLLIACSLGACKNEKKETPETNTATEEVAVDTQKQQGIKIHPIEHATTVLEWNGYTIYIDPTGGAAAFKGHKTPDLILITDIHGDHMNVQTLEELDTSKTKIIVPQAVADALPSDFDAQTDVLNNGDSKERYGINVEAIPMYNLREEALKFHAKGRGNGYVLNMGGQRVYFSGDTEDIPEMRALKDIDIAFVCMNLPWTMTVESAADAVLDFKPKKVYPYHYRGRPDMSDVAKFKRIVNTGNPDIEVVQLNWY